MRRGWGDDLRPVRRVRTDEGSREIFGAAMICRECAGTGGEVWWGPRLPPREAYGRRRRWEGAVPDAYPIHRVYWHTAGEVVAAGIDTGGVTYEEWWADPWSVMRRGAEPRTKTCPAAFYQIADQTRQPEWEECQALRQYARFSACRWWAEKAACWERWDREFPAAENGLPGDRPPPSVTPRFGRLVEVR